MKLEIEEISAPRSFVFLWCGSGEGLDLGRMVTWSLIQSKHTFNYRQTLTRCLHLIFFTGFTRFCKSRHESYFLKLPFSSHSGTHWFSVHQKVRQLFVWCYDNIFENLIRLFIPDYSRLSHSTETPWFNSSKLSEQPVLFTLLYCCCQWCDVCPLLSLSVSLSHSLSLCVRK